jgi:triacylglycerol lipase
MGGILLRQYLHDHGVPRALGRVVMLAPPNQGSEIVDRLRPLRFWRAFTGPAGAALGTGPDDAPARLGPWPATAGPLLVMAGDFSWNPLLAAWLPGPSDGKVTVTRTHLSGEHGHITQRRSHTWIMWRQATFAEVAEFIGPIVPYPHSCETISAPMGRTER